MRVLLDATAIPANRGGVGRYIDELLPALARTGLEMVVASQARDAALFAAAVPSAEVVPVPHALTRRAVRLVWEQVRLPALVRATRADVLHSQHYTMPRRCPVPTVVTLHDATFFSDPELHTLLKRRFFRAAIRSAVRRAAALVVPSEATGREVRRYAGGAASSFHVAHHGVDGARFHPVDAAEKARVAATLGLAGRDYVAFLGTLEPRKNVPALIRGWVQAVADRADPPALVLAGGPGWDDQVGPTLAAVPAHLTVVRPGYLPVDDLAGLLGGAVVVAYQALGEGFGLPVLEAMACAAPVLTTRRLSLPEVGGEAVEYCDVDASAIAAALTGLLDDPALRSRLSTAAVARAAGFTWDASAQVHLAAYRAASGRD